MARGLARAAAVAASAGLGRRHRRSRPWRTAETAMVVYSSVGFVLTNIPRMSSDSFSEMPSISSLLLIVFCRFTIH